MNKVVAYLKDGTYVFGANLPVQPRVGEFVESAGMLFEIKMVTYVVEPGYSTTITIKLIVNYVR